MAKKCPRLIRSGRFDLPLVEASGVAVRVDDSGIRVLAIGDRTTTLALGRYVGNGHIADWRTVDLTRLNGWPMTGRASQLEAIAADGGSLVALMSEDPANVFVVDVETREIRSTIKLIAPPGSALAGHWDDPSSRGEGLVLLSGGRLLVAKEKRPRALIEFAPIGQAAQGLSRAGFLADDESWMAPTGDVEFVATAMWPLRGRAKKTLGDISALAVGRDRDLWLLSDKTRTVARLSLQAPLPMSGGEIRRFDEAWRLPKGTEKPEGVAALDVEHVIVVMDTESKHDNGMILIKPESPGEP